MPMNFAKELRELAKSWKYSSLLILLVEIDEAFVDTDIF